MWRPVTTAWLPDGERLTDSDGVCGIEPVIDGSDGSELPESVAPGPCAGASLGPLRLEHVRSLCEPSDGVNSLTTSSIRLSVTIFDSLARNAKYESSMSSKSIGPSHSSQRQVGARYGFCPTASRVSIRSTFSRSHCGQKYGA